MNIKTLIKRPAILAAVHPSVATTLTYGEVAGRLARIPVQRVLGPEITAVGPRTPLVEAVRLMRARRLKVLPVVRGAELVGLVTEGEMLALLEELLESATPP
jgi:CBS domain-containing protein